MEFSSPNPHKSPFSCLSDFNEEKGDVVGVKDDMFLSKLRSPPKLDIYNLFAFRTDDIFTNAFSDCGNSVNGEESKLSSPVSPHSTRSRIMSQDVQTQEKRTKRKIRRNSSEDIFMNYTKEIEKEVFGKSHEGIEEITETTKSRSSSNSKRSSYSYSTPQSKTFYKSKTFMSQKQSNRVNIYPRISINNDNNITEFMGKVNETKSNPHHDFAHIIDYEKLHASTFTRLSDVTSDNLKKDRSYSCLNDQISGNNGLYSSDDNMSQCASSSVISQNGTSPNLPSTNELWMTFSPMGVPLDNNLSVRQRHSMRSSNEYHHPQCMPIINRNSESAKSGLAMPEFNKYNNFYPQSYPASQIPVFSYSQNNFNQKRNQIPEPPLLKSNSIIDKTDPQYHPLKARQNTLPSNPSAGICPLKEYTNKRRFLSPHHDTKLIYGEDSSQFSEARANGQNLNLQSRLLGLRNSRENLTVAQPPNNGGRSPLFNDNCGFQMCDKLNPQPQLIMMRGGSYMYNGMATNLQNIKSGMFPQPPKPDEKMLYAMNNPINTTIKTNKNIINNAFQYSKEQGGCRLLQKKLEENNPEVTSAIFKKLQPNLSNLMTDPFGNYLCQKLIELVNDEEILEILKTIANSISDICMNSHGTRAIQKLIDRIKENSNFSLVFIKLINKCISALVQDLHGNHVIQKCLTVFDDPLRDYIYNAIVNNTIQIATHKQGCCVIQKCLENGNMEQINKIGNEIVKHTNELIKDPFGNYVVQYVLQLNNDIFTGRILQMIKPQIVEYSKQKFSSNVIEKCLNFNNEQFRTEMIEELLQPSHLIELIQDQFGNYVIQKVLAIVYKEEPDRIIATLKRNSSEIKKSPLGKKIFTKLGQKYKELNEVEIGNKKERKNSSVFVGKKIYKPKKE